MKQSVPSGTTGGQVAETILEALPGDCVLESNALATVTTNCLIVRSAEEKAQTIIPIVHLSSIRTAKTTYPGLLVVSAACLLISAASYCSKQESGAALPAGLLGVFFYLAYVGYRRMAVVFITKTDRTVTGEGSTGEAKALIKAVLSVQEAKAAREVDDSTP